MTLCQRREGHERHDQPHDEMFHQTDDETHDKTN
jgi:hypothetical protein